MYVLISQNFVKRTEHVLELHSPKIFFLQQLLGNVTSRIYILSLAFNAVLQYEISKFVY
jgi:hypothetical protein